MNASVNPNAGRLTDLRDLADIPSLVVAYYAERPDPGVVEQRVSFGTSGHRGSSLTRSFNERHILAVTQAICEYRKKEGIDGPLFIGLDTHALSRPAFVTALEVLAAHDVTVMVAANNDFTPTPVISRAILAYNRRRQSGLSDGIVITPSHNPPGDGGFKYNPPHGGPAGSAVTGWIEGRANELLGGAEIARVSYEQALRAPTTVQHDYVTAYVDDLASVIDLEAIRASGLHLAVDALGGAGIHYWHRIAERYGLDLTVLNDVYDPTFRFITRDWDGKIRMDPSSPDAMRSLIGLKDDFDLAFACDTDHDRHGIVTKSAGLMQPNHYLAAAIDYLITHRPDWKPDIAIGKTVVSSSIIDRVVTRRNHRVHETPVGFKWFVDGLTDGWIGFCGEESAGATFVETSGQVWTTDKDGITAGLLSAEMTARTGRDPAELYKGLTEEVGTSYYRRSDAPANKEQRTALGRLTPDTFKVTELAGEAVQHVLTHAPGDGSAIGGIKVVAANGWFAVRPSGTEDVYKIYAESFIGDDHLRRIEDQSRQLVGEALSVASAAA
ncbi:phosphoglucomutase (alpha-D-glucose-1,6-bisphosphate-dependent) [Flaviflagellibacter deserti]|uniref:Phosphoglucomutase n=1 Tax=Flaviflagellibacter deserti TaxID=2267266 RepID=A0ABV9Z5H9_9HYPH